MLNNSLSEIAEKYGNSNCDVGLGIIYETNVGFPCIEENAISCNFFQFPSVVDSRDGISYERYYVGKIIDNNDYQRALNGSITYEQLTDFKKSINKYYSGLHVAVKIGLTGEFIIAPLYENTRVFDNIDEMRVGIEKRCQAFNNLCPNLSHTIIKKVQQFEKRENDILISPKTYFDGHRKSL